MLLLEQQKNRMLINVRDFGKGKQMTGLAIFLVILTAMDLVGYTVNKKTVADCGNKIH